MTAFCSKEPCLCLQQAARSFTFTRTSRIFKGQKSNVKARIFFRSITSALADTIDAGDACSATFLESLLPHG